MASASAPLIAVAGVCGAEDSAESRTALEAMPSAREGLSEVLKEGRKRVEGRGLIRTRCGEVEKGLAEEGFRGRRVEGEETDRSSIVALRERFGSGKKSSMRRSTTELSLRFSVREESFLFGP